MIAMGIDSGVLGGLIRMLEGAIQATPTLVVGLLIAALLRYYFSTQEVRDLFGGESLRSLPQSWALGMLLPVCSIGVLPILMEMRRARVKPGALSAFALSAPLFNPLSLLYGLTLSRPIVILMFALASLVVVTLVGLIWDRFASADETSAATDPAETTDRDGTAIIGVTRLLAVIVHLTRQLVGKSGGWSLVALGGLMLLSLALPYGSLQTSVESSDWSAPATMTLVALPAYATPMLAMSQLGMMFQHANSPGAAFVLLVLGAGVNIGTLLWLATHDGLRSVTVWFLALLFVVVSLAYAVNRPLIPPGVEPAGHTHAFDVYTNPIHSLDTHSWAATWSRIKRDAGLEAFISVGLLVLLGCVGIGLRIFAIDEASLIQKARQSTGGMLDMNLNRSSFDRVVSPRVVRATMISGLIAMSVVMCYGYYPSPEEALKEISIARTETLSAANSGQLEHAAYWLEIWEDWSRRLEVGAFLRQGELRPYQRMQGYLIRKKLELLDHELHHDPPEPEEIKQVVSDLLAANQRWVRAFTQSPP